MLCSRLAKICRSIVLPGFSSCWLVLCDLEFKMLYCIVLHYSSVWKAFADIPEVTHRRKLGDLLCYAYMLYA
jgi:hypothetical protein